MPLQQKLYCQTTGCRMAYVVKEIARNLKDRFAENDIDLTLEQYFILNILENEEKLILRELATIVDRDKSAVLRHIDRLEKNHFVTRITDQKDKRRKLLSVTKRGLQVLQKARTVDDQLNRDLMNQVEIDKNEFSKALSTMYKFLT